MAPPDSIFGARERRRIWRGADRDHSVITLGGSLRLMRPKRLKYLRRCPSDCQLGKKSAISAISAESLVVMPRLSGFASKMDPLRQNPDGQKGSLRVEPSSISDKRDDVFARALGIGGSPVCHPASWPFGPGCLRRVPGGVGFRKLSKLLYQEDA